MYCKFCGAFIDNNTSICPSCRQSQTGNSHTQIRDYQALVRRAEKMVTEFGDYPLMPEGDLSFRFIEDVFYYNPLFVLDDLKKSVMDMLLKVTQFRYDQSELLPILDETYYKHEREHKERILEILKFTFSESVDSFGFKFCYYRTLRRPETLVFYYAYSIFYIAKDIHDESSLLFARQALQALRLFHCERDSAPFDSIKSTGKLLELSEFSQDRRVYEKLLRMIEKEIETNGSDICKRKLAEQKQEEAASSKKGCYVATCVYGSYDCPQVWTLRRYRDNILAQKWFGRVFIRTYYAVSPNLVKWFGQTEWFKRLWKGHLDRMVQRLQHKGVESTPYQDEIW